MSVGKSVIQLFKAALTNTFLRDAPYGFVVPSLATSTRVNHGYTCAIL